MIRLAALFVLISMQAVGVAQVSARHPFRAQRSHGAGWKGAVINAGSDVKVEIQPGISVTFPTVKAIGGITSRVVHSDTAAPEGYEIGDPPTYIQMRAGVKYAGTAEICVKYDPQKLPEQGADTRLLILVNKLWYDHTESIDRQQHIVCGQVPKFTTVLVAVRTLKGLYEDLARVVRQIPNQVIVEQLATPLLASRDAALKKDRPVFEAEVDKLRQQVKATAQIPPQIQEAIDYYLGRIDARLG